MSRKMLGGLAAAVVLALPAAASARVAWEFEQVHTDPSAFFSSVAVGDVTGDGIDDVVAVPDGRADNGRPGEVITLIGSAGGEFAQPTSTSVTDQRSRSGHLAQIELADLNNDGLQDVLFLSPGAFKSLYSLISNGDGTFTNLGLVRHGGANAFVYATTGFETMDANGDQFVDIALGDPFLYETSQGILNRGERLGNVRIGLGAGDGTFTFSDEQIHMTRSGGDAWAEPSGPLAVGNLDGAGIDDIASPIVTYSAPPEVRATGFGVDALLSGPNGAYSVRDVTGQRFLADPEDPFNFSLPGATEIGDFNSDGAGDIVVGQWTFGEGEGAVHLYAGDGQGGFGRSETVFSDGSVLDAAVGDFDLQADGRQDLMVANGSIRADTSDLNRVPSLVNWIRNGPDGLEVRPISYRKPDETGENIAKAEGASIATGTFNADAVPDFAVGAAGRVFVFRSFDDVEPPETSLDEAAAPSAVGAGVAAKKRGKQRSKTLKFRFRSSEKGSVFKCKLDKRKYKPCLSPYKVKKSKLRRGKHVLKVRATDLAGNRERKPARLKFRIGGR